MSRLAGSLRRNCGYRKEAPERNEWRFYRLGAWPDQFGRALLARQWGRIGTQGRVRLDPPPEAGAAINALAQLARAKRRRGYRDGFA